LVGKNVVEKTAQESVHGSFQTHSAHQSPETDVNVNQIKTVRGLKKLKIIYAANLGTISIYHLLVEEHIPKKERLAGQRMFAKITRRRGKGG